MIVTSTDLPRAASLLSFQPASGTWEERAEYARRAGDALAAGHEIEAAADLLGVLADDSNWRVRHEVAQQMLWVPEDRSLTSAPGRVARETLAQLKTTFRKVRRYRQIVRLLVARLLYNDGLITIFAFGGIYAAETFGFSMEEVLIFGIALNVAAGVGAFAMGYLDDRIGGKRD